jgi:hypothetical protein
MPVQEILPTDSAAESFFRLKIESKSSTRKKSYSAKYFMGLEVHAKQVSAYTPQRNVQKQIKIKDLTLPLALRLASAAGLGFGG